MILLDKRQFLHTGKTARVAAAAVGALLSLAVGLGVDKDRAFKPGPASSYPGAQTNDGVTVVAVPFETDDQARPAFGKENPYKHGVLPILVIVENKGKGAIRLENMRVELLLPERERIEPTPAPDVPYLTAPRRPGVQKPLPPLRKHKNPLGIDEIQLRAFSAKMLPAGDSAHGFFYFQSGLRDESRLYLTGITEAASGKEMLFFEVPVTRQK